MDFHNHLHRLRVTQLRPAESSLSSNARPGGDEDGPAAEVEAGLIHTEPHYHYHPESFTPAHTHMPVTLMLVLGLGLELGRDSNAC